MGGGWWCRGFQGYFGIVKKSTRGTRPGPALCLSFLTAMTCAQFRGGQKKATNRVDRSLRHQDCLRARDEVFEDRIHQLIIQTAIDKRGDLEQQLLKNKRLPYGTMPNIIRKLAEARITTNRLTLTSTFPNDFTVDNWIEYIEENYERLFNLHGSTPPPTKSQTASNWYEDITVVQHPMNRLLSKELGEDEKAAFKDLLRSRAVDITDTIATVALAGRMHVINYARYGFTQQPQQPRPQSSQSQQQPQPSRPRRSSRSQQSQPNPSQPVPPQVSHSQHISIKKICPRSPARITTHLLDSDRIPVIPPHPRLQQMMEDDDDIKQYLDFHHLSFILNNINKRSKAKHDTWHTCLNAIELKPSFIMHGHSHLKATAVRKLSTNISNMWRKSKLYWDVLRHLSRLLIRLHLAPIREQKRYNRMSGAKVLKECLLRNSCDGANDCKHRMKNTQQ